MFFLAHSRAFFRPGLSLDLAFHMYRFVTSRRIALAALRRKVEQSMNRKHRGEANTNSQKTSIMNRAKAEQIRRRHSTDDDSKRGEGGGVARKPNSFCIPFNCFCFLG